jgi:UDP-2-acetamido-3-amino-2,3-dideoxy-glucuronate N-acetyltransferase
MLFTNVVNPRSHVAGKDEYTSTVVRQSASRGANCTIVCGTTIGRYASIGAGSVVTRDIPDYVLTYGTRHGCGARLDVRLGNWAGISIP